MAPGAPFPGLSQRKCKACPIPQTLPVGGWELSQPIRSKAIEFRGIRNVESTISQVVGLNGVHEQAVPWFNMVSSRVSKTPLRRYPRTTHNLLQCSLFSFEQYHRAETQINATLLSPVGESQGIIRGTERRTMEQRLGRIVLPMRADDFDRARSPGRRRGVFYVHLPQPHQEQRATPLQPQAGELRHGMVLYGMVWYGVVWCGMVWCYMVRYGMVWYGMVLYGMVWHDMAWHGTVVASRIITRSLDSGEPQLRTKRISVSRSVYLVYGKGPTRAIDITGRHSK